MLAYFQDWMFEKQGRNVSHQFVWNKEQFDHVNPTQTDFILGESAVKIKHVFYL